MEAIVLDMITAKLSMITHGEAMNKCSIAFVVDCHSPNSSINFVLRTRHKDVWNSITKAVSFDRVGYNFVSYILGVSPATYAEVEVTSLNGIDVIYHSMLSAMSTVAV